MKLTIEHLAPYLPYGLKIWSYELNKEIELYCLSKANEAVYINSTKFYYHVDKFKPILRPLSDLTKGIYHNEKKFIPIQKLKQNMLVDFEYKDKDGIMSIKFPKGNVCIISICKEIADECPFGFYNKLIEWHFDVFGLIEKGLAININTIEP